MRLPHLSHRQRNRLHAALLLSAMLLLLIALGTSLFGSDSLLLILFAAGTAVLLTPRASAWLTLRLYHARHLASDSVPGLYRIVEVLARRAGLSRQPLLFYVPSAMPNAFAMLEGGQPLIAVTDGLLRNLSQRELAAVLAHEISHIRNGDLDVMMVADLLSRLTAALSSVGWLMLMIVLPLWLLTGTTLPWLTILLLLCAPAGATLLQLALSRSREFDADLDAVRLTGDPAGLASALAKIEQASGRRWFGLLIPVRRGTEPSWLRTHPSTQERVRRLQALAADIAEPVFKVAVPIHVAPQYHVIAAPRRWHGPGVWY
ncbi:MAG: zinc metalloprotease HtpX [Mariprofundaceae bacterium]|nr:zinc metalloprotease HtpX [Mariprofundaceae bacterium]